MPVISARLAMVIGQAHLERKIETLYGARSTTVKRAGRRAPGPATIAGRIVFHLMTWAGVSPSRRRAVVQLVVFAYLLAVRTWNITEIFGLLGDQVLYWNLALRPW